MVAGIVDDAAVSREEAAGLYGMYAAPADRRGSAVAYLLAPFLGPPPGMISRGANRVIRGRWALRVLVVQNFDGTGLGLVGAALAEATPRPISAALISARRCRGSTSGDDALVVLGGGQNALRPSSLPLHSGVCSG